MNIRISSSVRNVKPVLMGADHFPVVFSNIGMSSADAPLVGEIERLRAVIAAGADAVSDLTLVGDIAYEQQKMLECSPVPFASVAAYEVYSPVRTALSVPHPEDFIRVFEAQAARGVDIITLHATARTGDLSSLDSYGRLIPCTSRGGAMMLELMEKGGYDNPYYSYFEDVLKICKRYRTCISLGPCYRPGSVVDAGEEDALHFAELARMGELVAVAQAAGVGIAIEGIGHAPINKIPTLVSMARSITHGAPYRVLNVATDIAMGFDHVSSAIGSSVAVQYGADSITAVTRSEHLGIPTLPDLVEAVRSARVAAHCGYVARTGDLSRDEQMARARHERGCIGCSEAALFPELVSEYIEKNRVVKKDESCTMCGDFCPFVILKKKGDA